VGYYDLKREAQAEFGRVLVRSLLESAELEAAKHESGGIHRRSQKRVEELRLVLAGRSAVGTVEARQGWAWLLRLVTGLYLVSFAVTIAYLAAWGINRGTALVDVALLATTVAWLCACLAAMSPSDGTSTTATASGTPAVPAADEEDDAAVHAEVVARLSAWLAPVESDLPPP
jgi:hypothetical protein